MKGDHSDFIDLYPGDLSIEDVPAEFSVEVIEADPSVGELGGKWATLESIRLGGLTLLKREVELMVGYRTVYAIEETISERLSSCDADEPTGMAAE